MFFKYLCSCQLLQRTSQIRILVRFRSDVSQCNRTLHSLKSNGSNRRAHTIGCYSRERALLVEFLAGSKLLLNICPQSSTVPQPARPSRLPLCATRVVRSRSRYPARKVQAPQGMNGHLHEYGYESTASCLLIRRERLE